MNKFIFAMLLTGFVSGCSDSDNVIDQISSNISNGAALRTLEIRQGEFYVNEPESIFDIVVEEMDDQNGDLLSSVNIYLSFVDNTQEGGDNSIPRSLFQTLDSSDFSTGPNGFPIISLEYRYSELQEELGLSLEDTNCNDQFRLDLELFLTDGRVFKNDNSSNSIIHTVGSFQSPFSYLINIVEPVSEGLFVGEYQLQHIQDGFFGPTFVVDQPVFIEIGHSTNVRTFEFRDVRIYGRTVVEFTIACDRSVITRYIRASNSCIDGEPVTSRPPEGSLLGPDIETAVISSEDDSVVEIWYVEGFEGRSDGCNYSDFPAKIRLTKQ